MSAQTCLTLPALGGAKPVYADIRTNPYLFHKCIHNPVSVVDLEIWLVMPT